MTGAPCLDALIQREGGYVDHPADKGGPTCFGITEPVARAYGFTGSMHALPLAVASDIYLKRYWQEPRFDAVEVIAPVIATKLFDIGVNMGTGVAGRFLQRALNVLNSEAKWPDLTADGRIGTLTLFALRTFCALRGAEGAAVLRSMISSQQGTRYIEIAEGDPSQRAFQLGWQRVRTLF